MGDRIHVERPERNVDVLQEPMAEIAGWCTSSTPGASFTLSLNDRVLEHTATDRPDVRRAFPELWSFGFSYRLSPAETLQLAGTTIRVRFELGSAELERTLTLDPTAVEDARAWDEKKARKRELCLSVLLCPMCRAARPSPVAGGALCCPGCGQTLPQTRAALDLLPADLYQRFNLRPTERVSANHYSPGVVAQIKEVKDAGGTILDCGAGFRTVQDERIVNVEIVDYPSTDVLAVGQALPFEDGTFDLVLSLAVLEHVDDPFTCAAELARVTKPGGRIYCTIPFLQPEHGYPNHYFNATRQGMLKLFEKDCRVLTHVVPPHGAPIHTLQELVAKYLSHLPPDARAEAEELTLGDIARLRKDELSSKAYVRDLSDEGSWSLASITTALFERLG